MIPLGALLGMAIAYVLGSLPFGYWVARVRGVDIQKVGSGNTGATNVLRALGPKAAIPVLLLDVGKGFGGAWLGQTLAAALGGDPSLAAVLGGLAAFAGHNWSLFLHFTGGKGVSAGAGAALYLLPVGVALGVTVFVLTIAITRYVSLGSILAAASVGVFTLLGPYPADRKVFALLAAVLIVYRHRANIGRLLAGTEARFGQRLSAGGSGQAK